MPAVIITDGRYRSAIAAARELGRAGYDVVVTETRADMPADPPVFSSKFARGVWIEGSVRDPEYPDRLEAFLREYDRPILLPVGAATLRTISEQKARFSRFSDFVIADPAVLEALNDKNRGCTFAKKRCLDEADGADHAAVVLEHLREGQFLVFKDAVPVPEPAEDARKADRLLQGLLRIEENIPGQQAVLYLLGNALHPFPLDDHRGNAGNAVGTLDDGRDDGAFLGLAEVTVGVAHRFFVRRSYFWQAPPVPESLLFFPGLESARRSAFCGQGYVPGLPQPASPVSNVLSRS